MIHPDESPTSVWRAALRELDQLDALDAGTRERRMQTLARSQPRLHRAVVALAAGLVADTDTGHDDQPGSSRAARAAALEGQPHRSPRPHERMVDLLAQVSDDDDGAHDQALDAPPMEGTEIGPWRITGLLGRGGMGEVWRAERTDGRYTGQVAVKVMTHVGIAAARRFRREGRLLARLAHPNIARLLDAGTLQSGRPYLVLEHVDGQRIDAWCDAQRLPVAGRVDLMRQVCDAVAHAHRNLVVHRDLKPSNVLVRTDGQAVLLDFGIATLLEPGPGEASDDATSATREGRAMTPEYAAPEQVAGEPITTATDVHALGLMLYRLVAGRHPYAASGTTQPSTPAQWTQALMSSEPQSLTGVAFDDELAARRACTTAQLRRALRSDLSNVVGKALRRQPTERYASADALSEDLARWRRNEPVQARRDGLAYRMRKLVQRNPALAATTAALALALVIGTAATAWMGMQARQQAEVARGQERRAEAQARRAESVRDYLVGLFRTTDVDNPEGAQARAVTAQDLLDRGIESLDRELADQPAQRIDLLHVLADIVLNQGDLARAVKLSSDAHDLTQRHFPDDVTMRATAQGRLGYALMYQGEHARAIDLLTQAMTGFDQVGDLTSHERAGALMNRAFSLYRTRPATDPAAETGFREALAILRAHHPRRGVEIVTAINGLAKVADFRGDTQAAESHFRSALDEAQSRLGAWHPDTAGVQHEFGMFLLTRHRFGAAREMLEQASQSFERQAGARSMVALDAKRDLAHALFVTGRWQDADAMLAQIVAAIEHRYGVDDAEHSAFTRSRRALVLASLGRLDDARREADRAAAWHAKQGVPAFEAYALQVRARIHRQQGSLDAALADATRALALRRRHSTEQSASVADALLQLAEVQLARGEQAAAHDNSQQAARITHSLGEASPLRRLSTRVALARSDAPAAATAALREVLGAIEQHPERDALAAEEASASLALGRALLDQGDATHAAAVFERALDLRIALAGDTSLPASEPRAWLALTRATAGDAVGARALLEQVQRSHRAQTALGPEFTQPVERALARLR